LDVTGLIYEIERFAIHDGPGIRTLVFMKGCPLRCLWCSSPHTQKAVPEILYSERECQRCGQCAEACPIGAIMLSPEDGVTIDRERCDACGKCVEACPYGAQRLAGTRVTPEELLRQVERDSAFYRRSGGGVTIGGGEPAVQHEFVAEFLGLCKKQYIHTAIETCGCVPWEHMEKLLDNLDLVYIDIKHMDAEEHKKLTGVSNDRVLENARRIAERRPVIVRVPIVPGLNDSDENILATARFAAGLGDNLQSVELLPYHKLGIEMYRRLGREYSLASIESPDDEHMQQLKEIAQSCGVDVQIGG